MIIDILERNHAHDVAFFLSNFPMIDFIKMCQDEGIVFTKGGFPEDVNQSYHLSSDIALIFTKYSRYHLTFSLDASGKESQIGYLPGKIDSKDNYAFYSRKQSEWNTYGDEHRFVIIDFKQHLRSEKLNNILL